MNKSRLNAKGFTIVELMIATAVFSIVLLIVTAGVINVSRQYYKGITSNKTQNITRNAVNEIAQAVQFSSGRPAEIYSGTNIIGYCISGSKGYYFQTGNKIGGSYSHALVSVDSCSGSAPDYTKAFSDSSNATLSSPRELLADKMRLVAFDITSGGLESVHIKVAYGDDDLLCSPQVSGGCSATTDFTDPKLRCRGGVGSEFCATSELTISVGNRLQWD